MSGEIVMRVHQVVEKGMPIVEVRIGEGLWRTVVYVKDTRGDDIEPRHALAHALDKMARFLRNSDGRWKEI